MYDTRSMPGSGMPPSRAPRIGNQVSQGRPFAGSAPGMQQPQQAGGMNPMALMMLMRMLQQQGGGNAGLLGQLGAAGQSGQTSPGLMGAFSQFGGGNMPGSIGGAGMGIDSMGFTMF